MAQTQGPAAMSAQHMPMPMYSPASFVSMPGAQGYHAPQSVQQPSHPMQYALQPAQQVHMVQQAHEMQHALHGYNFEGDNFVDAFGAAQRRHVQCSNCNTYENMFDLLCNYVLHNTLDCPLLQCNMCKMRALVHLRLADSECCCIRFDSWQHRLAQGLVQLPLQRQLLQKQQQGGGRTGDYSQHRLMGAHKNGRPSCLHEGALEAVVCRVADFDLELAQMALMALNSLDDLDKLAGIDVCYNSTFHMCEEHVHMANMTRAGL